MIFVVQIHNYYGLGPDSLNYKRNIDSVYNKLIRHERIPRIKNPINMFVGYVINDAIFNHINSLPIDEFLVKYFDREGNIKAKENKKVIEIWAVCYLNNITFFLERYYYPAIYEATWNELKTHYPQLNKLPKPKQPRYIE
ncbi:hypothetical protein PDL71_13040 [Lacibacter sp. MH-610]|uniref:hypothetical protein n=1 Tax=Lacibacter sp. MH-610 TaxID=3020883 RepID=UPI00389281D4